MARTFYYYDVLNGLILDALILPYRTAELAIAHNKVEALADDTVTVYDRNFCSWRLFALHLWAERPKRFVIRAKESHLFVRRFLASGSSDQVVDLLPGGGTEVLATNLQAEQGYSGQELKELYFLRWGVETPIDFQKNTLMLESSSGLSVTSVAQDFYATAVLANLQMCVIRDAQGCLDEERATGWRKGAKHAVQVNRNKASFRVKDRLPDLFMGSSPRLVLQGLHNHFKHDVLPVRKGRSFARKRKKQQTNSKHRTFTNYKMA